MAPSPKRGGSKPGGNKGARLSVGNQVWNWGYLFLFGPPWAGSKNWRHVGPSEPGRELRKIPTVHVLLKWESKYVISKTQSLIVLDAKVAGSFLIDLNLKKLLSLSYQVTNFAKKKSDNFTTTALCFFFSDFSRNFFQRSSSFRFISRHHLFLSLFVLFILIKK